MNGACQTLLQNLLKNFFDNLIGNCAKSANAAAEPFVDSATGENDAQ